MKRVCSIDYSEYDRASRAGRLCEALAGRGDSVECLALRPSDAPAHEVIGGVRVSRVQSPGGGRSRASRAFAHLRFVVRAGVSVASRHSEQRYDVVHVQGKPHATALAALLPRVGGARVILDIHDALPERSGAGGWIRRLLIWEERLAAAIAHQVCCVDDVQLEVLARRGLPRRKLRVVMDAPDERVWVPAPGVIDDEEVRPEPFLIACTETAAPGRGFDVTVAAVAALEARMPNLRLRVIGSEPALARVRRLADELGIPDRLDCADAAASAETTRERLAAADVAFVPAGEAGGLPTSVLEYATMGLPMIAPETPTIAHYFTGDMVRFVTPDDVDALAGAIWELAGDSAARRNLARAAHRFAERHSWTHEREEFFHSIDGDDPADAEAAAA